MLKTSDLLPEEKLMYAIFGWPSSELEVKHFLSEDGVEAVGKALVIFVESHPDVRRKTSTSYYLGISREQCRRGIKILRLRFGFEPRTELENKRPHLSDYRTLDETKVYFGVTRERIRQIEAKTLRALRASAQVKLLRKYL